MYGELTPKPWRPGEKLIRYIGHEFVNVPKALSVPHVSMVARQGRFVGVVDDAIRRMINSKEGSR